MSSPADLPPSTAHVKSETLPLGELLSDVTRDISTLMRQEVELAKVEIKDSASKAGKGAGMLGGAAYAGHITVLFLSIALWWALGQLVGLGWSAVIVAVIWGIIAAVLASVGRKELKAIKGLPRTAETVKEIPPALKPNTEETR